MRRSYSPPSVNSASPGLWFLTRVPLASQAKSVSPPEVAVIFRGKSRSLYVTSERPGAVSCRPRASYVYAPRGPCVSACGFPFVP